MPSTARSLAPSPSACLFPERPKGTSSPFAPSLSASLQREKNWQGMHLCAALPPLADLSRSSSQNVMALEPKWLRTTRN